MTRTKLETIAGFAIALLCLVAIAVAQNLQTRTVATPAPAKSSPLTVTSAPSYKGELKVVDSPSKGIRINNVQPAQGGIQ